MLQLVVDDRWRGEHGIGRFAAEVIRRLPAPWKPLGASSSPTSPLDVFSPYRARLSASSLVYSPGFNAGLTRARQVLTIHDLIHLQIPSESSRAKSLFYRFVVRPAIRRAGLVMTVSATSAEAIDRWVDDPDVEILVVGCGRSTEFAREGERREYSRPTFAYVGNLKPHKNVLVLLDALAARPDYSLIVVTADAEQARSEIEARGLESRVTVETGLSDKELASIYRGVTGALQPSLLEGFGLPALEAMSCGTRVGYWAGCESVSEICAGTGVSVSQATSADEWASAMDDLRLRSVTGDLVVSPEWEEKYDWDKVGERIADGLSRARA